MERLSRRLFLKRTGTGLAVGGVAVKILLSAAQTVGGTTVEGTAGTRIDLRVNGQEHSLEVLDHWTLVEVLRDHLRLTGTKIGCNRGECGACTVSLDGKPVYSCSFLAVWAVGKEILTVEGLEKNGKLDPLQQAFIDHDGPQCGFCTSGQLIAAKALLNSNPHPSRDDVRAAMTGNLCRCSNYNRYVEAVLAASEKERA